jgi:hypothetical protein
MTWVAVGTSAAIGAGIGAGSGILQGEDSDTILKKALIGGATGAVTGGIGAEATAATEVGMGLGEELTQEGIKAASDEAMKEALAQEALNPLTEIGNGINSVPAGDEIASKIISGTAQIGSPPPAGIEQIAPAAPSPVAGAPTGVNQFSPAELNAINQGQADAMMAQGTGTQVAGPAMNVTPPPPAGAPPAPAPEPVSNFGIKGVGPNPNAVNPLDTGVKPMIQGGNPVYPSTMGQLQPSVTASLTPPPTVTPPSSNPFMEGFASVKDFVKENPLGSAAIGYAGLTALDSFSPKQGPTKKKTYVNNYPISPNFQPSRPQPNVYQSRYAEGGITSFDDEAGVDQFAPGGSVRKERDSDADFKRYYSMMNGRPEVEADEESLRKPRFARDDDPETKHQDALTAALTRQNKNYARANISSPPVKRPMQLGTINLAPPGTQQAASGGIMGYDLGGYAAGGNPRLLKGPGDGMSDDIPAVIGRKQPARLADGEFVVPADVVSHLGNGSTDAGAKKLHQMMDKVRTDRTGKKRQAPEVNADKYLPGKKKASGGIAGYASGGIVGYADGGAANAQDIAGVYESYLGRTPSAAEIKSWQDTGASYDTISKGIRLSPEAATFSSNASNAEKIVTSLYQDQVGRAPDAEGLKFWSDALKNGQSVSDITKGINQSIEGQNFDTQYITSLYRQNLARNPEQAGYQYWLSEAQAAGYTPKEIEAMLKQAATPEQAKRDITGKTFTEMQLNALEADPYGGRYTTKSIYDLLPDATNVSTIGNQKAQFINPVTQQPYVTNYGEGSWTQKVGADVLNTPQVQAAITVARNNGTLSTAGYTALLADLRAATTMDQTRAALAKPQGQVVIDTIYGQQIGENVDLAAARKEAEGRQAVLSKQDPGYYQNNTTLTDAYKQAGLTVPFDYNAYKGVDTRTGQADVVTPENFQQKQNDLTRTLSTYKPTYPTLNRNTGLPPSVRDPYSDEGLKVLYGQMMDQYGPPPEGFINPATFVPEPYTYKPPVSTTLQKEAAAKAKYDAQVAADRLAYDKAGINESNFDAKAYLLANPDAGNRAIWQSTPYAHYVEANRLGDTRTATKLPFTPAPYAPTPLIASTPAPAPVIGAAADGPIANRAGGLMSIKHKKRRA